MKFRGKLLNTSEVASDYFKEFFDEEGSIRESVLHDHSFDCGFNDAIINYLSSVFHDEWTEELQEELQELVGDAFGYYDKAEGEAGEIYQFIQLVEKNLDAEADEAGYDNFAKLFKNYL